MGEGEHNDLPLPVSLAKCHINFSVYHTVECLYFENSMSATV